MVSAMASFNTAGVAIMPTMTRLALLATVLAWLAARGRLHQRETGGAQAEARAGAGGLCRTGARGLRDHARSARDRLGGSGDRLGGSGDRLGGSGDRLGGSGDRLGDRLGRGLGEGF